MSNLYFDGVSGTDGKSRVLNTGSSLGDLAKHSVSDAFAEAEL